MRDDLHLHTSAAPHDGHLRLTSDGKSTVTDREVPLGQQVGTLPMSLHLWLDGELPEAAVRTGTYAGDVAFWRRLNSTLADRSRVVRSPAGLEDRIMAALPQTAPMTISPWWRRELVVTPATVLGGGAALIAVTAVLTSILARI